MTRTEIGEWVVARMDEVNPTGQSPAVGDLLIEREMDEAAKIILRSAKKQLVYPAGISYAPDVFITQNAAGNPRSVIIPVTGTFLRFLRLKMYYWNKSVDDIVSVDSNTYIRQFNSIQGATINKPVCAIIPFQWAWQDESGAAIAITDVVYGEFQAGITTVKFGAAHGFVQNQQIDIAEVVGMADLTGTHTVLFVPTLSTLLIAFTPVSTTGTEGTAQGHITTASAMFTHAIEAFPAPSDFSTALTAHQISTGINATAAIAKRMKLVKNTALTGIKLPLIDDMQVVNELAAEAMPNSLLDAMVWLTAGRCLTMLREGNVAQTAYQNCNATLGQPLIGLKGEEVALSQKA
jgi:hypothetical protein